jgi:3-hydroxyacyl-[acyl-carrier-protein] dehydratase
MRFTLVDRIVLLEPGSKIVTIKALSLSEEYLSDHFPRFPVMPGVLMLEAMTQAGAWLIRATEDMAHSLITLKEAHNVRFRNLVAPGQVLTVSAKIVQHDDMEIQLATEGRIDNSLIVSGRLRFDRFNLSDTRPDLAPTDQYIKRHLREMLSVLYRPQVASLVES